MFFKNLKHTLLAAFACLALQTAHGQTQPWQTNGTNIYNTNTGRVGIGTGTSTPQTLLSIKQNEAISVGSRAYMSSGTTTNGGDFAHFSTNAWFGSGAWQYPNGVRKGALMQIKNDTINFFTHNGANGFTEKLSMYGNLAEFPQNQAVQLGNAYMSSGTDGNAQISHFGSNAWFGNGVWNFNNNKAGALMQTYNKEINFFTHDGNATSFKNRFSIKNVGSNGTHITAKGDGNATLFFLENANPTNIRYSMGTETYNSDGTRFKITRHGGGAGPSAPLEIHEDGSLTLGTGKKIGVTDPNDKITVYVNGKLQVSGGDLKLVPDYVFENDYKLKTLREVEEYVKKYKHLPNVKSRKDIEKAGGVDFIEMSYSLLEKVEELTLYTIEQDKKIKQQNELIEKLAQKVDALDKKVNPTK